jgi:hypothetical protein
MTLPSFYPTVRIPMYILTLVTQNGNLVYSEYKTRSEVTTIMENFKISPVMDGDDFVTEQLYYLPSGDRLIVTTIYLQNSIFNKKED